MNVRTDGRSGGDDGMDDMRHSVRNVFFHLNFMNEFTSKKQEFEWNEMEWLKIVAGAIIDLFLIGFEKTNLKCYLKMNIGDEWRYNWRLNEKLVYTKCGS